MCVCVCVWRGVCGVGGYVYGWMGLLIQHGKMSKLKISLCV